MTDSTNSDPELQTSQNAGAKGNDDNEHTDTSANGSDPSLQDAHNPETDEDTASGGSAD